MNEALLFVEIIAVFSMMLIFKKMLGKDGLFAWLAIAPIIANIQVIKCIDVFGISATLGNVLFSSVFLATDMLSEIYGKEEAKKGVKTAIVSVLLFIGIMQLSLLFVPNDIDIIDAAMHDMFSLSFRVCAASVSMFALANIIDVLIYDKLKRRFKNRKMWLRNNICTIICNCAENFGFCFIAFYNVYSNADIITIAVNTCIIETIIAICDTPFLYLAKYTERRIKHN